MNTHTLVLGGTGKTGRRIVERLRALDVAVRVGSRSLPFDWNDRSTWASMVDGVNAAYVSYYPDLAVPGAAETVGAFARLAHVDLTTVSQEAGAQAVHAVEAAVERLDGVRAAPREVVLSPRLVVRGTTGPPGQAERDG